MPICKECDEVMRFGEDINGLCSKCVTIKHSSDNRSMGLTEEERTKIIEEEELRNEIRKRNTDTKYNQNDGVEDFFNVGAVIAVAAILIYFYLTK